MAGHVGEEVRAISRARIVGAPSDELVDVHLEGGAVARIEPAGSAPLTGALDADGAFLIPGLWDAHVHFGNWAQTFTRLDLSGATSARQCARLLAEEARANPPIAGGAVIGMGYHGALWDPAPTTSLLDTVMGEIPAIAVSHDLHSAWLNTAAQNLLGLPLREGLVREGEWFALSPAVDALPAADPDEPLRAAIADAASRGVVGITDFDFGNHLDVWRERNARGLTQLRVRAGFYPEFLGAAIERGLATGDALSEDGLVTLGPLKIISDGSLNTKTAYCFDAYPGGGHGVLSVSEDELTRLAARAHEADIECAIHAIGDHANAIALRVFSTTGVRGSIEHAQLMRADDIDEMGERGITASIQPAHLLDDREPSAQLWPGKVPYEFQRLSKAGVPLTLGSDAPVSPLDPWLQIAAAVGRGEPEADAWEPAERLTPATALFSSTGGVGRILPGTPADLALLAADPLAPGISAADLRAMRVLATICAGRVTHAD